MTAILDVIRNMLLLAGYMTNGADFPDPLSREEEISLINQMLTGDDEARNKLIEHNLRLVSHIAKKYTGSGEDMDDLISIGAMGLVKAVSTFKPEKGALAAYASRCIENEIRMYLRAENRHRASESSLEDPVGRDSDGNEVTLGDRLCDTEADMEESAFHSIYHEQIREAVDSCLDDRERAVVEMRYALRGDKALTQREVAYALGVSRSYVSRIEKRALSKLTKRLGAR